MTARTIPENPRKHVQPAVVLILVFMGILLSAGCEDVQRSHAVDLVIIKLNHDGSTAWIKNIESGKNYWMNDLLQTSDGGYAIGGISSKPICNPQCIRYEDGVPTIIRLSDNGEIVAELGFPPEDMIEGLVQTPDGGFYAISHAKKVLFISPNGMLTGSRDLEAVDDLNKTDMRSFIRTDDGGSVVFGAIIPCQLDHNGRRHCKDDPKDYVAFVEKLDQNGNTSWSRPYGENGFSGIDQIIKLNGAKGYASVMKNDADSSLVTLDTDGFIIKISRINPDLNYYQLHQETDGFLVFCENKSLKNSSFEIHYFNNKGNIRDTRLGKIRYDYVTEEQNTTSGKTDLNYLSVNLIGSSYFVQPVTTTIQMLKSDEDGELIWKSDVPTVTSEPYYTHIWDFIETSDGGYVIAIGVERV